MPIKIALLIILGVCFILVGCNPPTTTTTIPTTTTTTIPTTTTTIPTTTTTTIPTTTTTIPTTTTITELTTTTTGPITTTTLPGWDQSWPPLEDGLVANVKDFGAKGDGVTDDTKAVQNAVDWVGGLVLLADVAPADMDPVKRAYYQWWEDIRRTVAGLPTQAEMDAEHQGSTWMWVGIGFGLAGVLVVAGGAVVWFLRRRKK